jgi:hypothetical protein
MVLQLIAWKIDYCIASTSILIYNPHRHYTIDDPIWLLLVYTFTPQPSYCVASCHGGRFGSLNHKIKKRIYALFTGQTFHRITVSEQLARRDELLFF